MSTSIGDYLVTKPGSKLSYPFGEQAAVYKVGDKMFAILATDKKPGSVSLKCDPELSKSLRENYESVMPGYHLNKRHWITIVMTGQLSEDEIKDLINHSYDLVVEGLSKEDQAKLTSNQ